MPGLTGRIARRTNIVFGTGADAAHIDRDVAIVIAYGPPKPRDIQTQRRVDINSRQLHWLVAVLIGDTRKRPVKCCRLVDGLGSRDGGGRAESDTISLGIGAVLGMPARHARTEVTISELQTALCGRSPINAGITPRPDHNADEGDRRVGR